MGTSELILSIICTILFTALAMALVVIYRMNVVKRKKRSDRLGKKPPYIDLGLDVAAGFMETHGLASTEFISRHWIAEHDVKCPRCEFEKVDTLLVEHGDYSGVHWTWVNNGVDRFKNECIYCDECTNWLLASPDTEHGDHDEEDKPEHNFFVRKTELEVTREKYGDDVVDRDVDTVYVADGGDRDATYEKPAAAPANTFDDKPLPTEPSPPLKGPVS